MSSPADLAFLRMGSAVLIIHSTKLFNLGWCGLEVLCPMPHVNFWKCGSLSDQMMLDFPHYSAIFTDDAGDNC